MCCHFQYLFSQFCSYHAAHIWHFQLGCACMDTHHYYLKELSQLIQNSWATKIKTFTRHACACTSFKLHSLEVGVSVSKDSRNLSTASNTNWYCSCEWDCDSKSAWVVWVIGYSPQSKSSTNVVMYMYYHQLTCPFSSSGFSITIALQSLSTTIFQKSPLVFPMGFWVTISARLCL